MGISVAGVKTSVQVTLDDEESPERAAEYQALMDRKVAFQRWAKKLMLHPNDLQVFLDDGFTYERIPPAGTPNQRAMLAYLKKRGGPPAKWVIISGILPDENGVAAEERRRQLRALHKATTLLVRRSLGRAEADPNKEERSIFWDPAVEVCRELEICQSKLSALLKEFCGNSLIQVVDCVRVEHVRRGMRAELRRFIGTLRAGKSAQSATSEMKLDAWEVWKSLKATRRWPEFSQNTWANELGFSTYRRLYRACVAVFRKTPHQLEMDLIQEFLKEGETKTERDEVPDFIEMTLPEIESLVREIPRYARE